MFYEDCDILDVKSVVFDLILAYCGNCFVLIDKLRISEESALPSAWARGFLNCAGACVALGFMKKS